MIISIQSGGRTFEVDGDNPVDISIPLKFNGEQPNAYGVEKATSSACESGDLVGDTRRGGSCNFEQYTLIPHCNGTHTECVGHITDERISVRECLEDVFIPARLISVTPTSPNGSSDTYPVKLNSSDPLITKASIKSALAVETAKLNYPLPEVVPTGLIVRTLPNRGSVKLRKSYIEDIPPFFSSEAMLFIVELGIKHLLVDIPSIDRIYDEGKLSNHRIFWNLSMHSKRVNRVTRRKNTITELIYVPNKVTDGNYLLNLQIAPFESDASPSRPVIFKIT